MCTYHPCQIPLLLSLQRGRGYGRGMDSAPGHGMTLADALDDYSSTSDGSSFQPHYDASLGSVLTTAAGFVLEALEKRGIKMATLLLTQMVRWARSRAQTHTALGMSSDHMTFSQSDHLN